jgi:predicted RNA-binding protein (virulence factor B family)
MIEPGKINKLKVVRESPAGLHLTDNDNNEVLIPASHVREKYKAHDKLDVFVYHDSENRLAATTRKPLVMPGNFAFLRCTSVTEHGAFLDWGIEKDLFVPFAEQHEELEKERFYVVYITVDDVSGRLIGSTRVENFLSNEGHTLEGGQEVEIMLYHESDLGFSCIINGKHQGLIYHNDIYQDLFIGEELHAYIKTVRDDGLIDVSLQKSGFKNVLSATETILAYLEEHGGELDLHDKSSPQEISEKFNMSKATFKKSIGILYRQRKVLIKPDGVTLVKDAPGEEEKKGEE